MSELVLIAAVDRRGAIGRDNELLVRLPEDMAHFKALTLGHTVIMGRKTWDSLPERYRPLPQRRNIVLSRQDGLKFDGAEVFASLEAAVAACAGDSQVFVIGGEQVYRQALPHADVLELTEIDAEYPADAFFPGWRGGEFDEVARQPGRQLDASGDAGPAFDFVRYRRRR
jgi:dihydrofolate reductase